MSCAQRANCSEPEVLPVLLDSKSYSPYREYDIYAGQLVRTLSLTVDSRNPTIDPPMWSTLPPPFTSRPAEPTRGRTPSSFGTPPLRRHTSTNGASCSHCRSRWTGKAPTSTHSGVSARRRTHAAPSRAYPDVASLRVLLKQDPHFAAEIGQPKVHFTTAPLRPFRGPKGYFPSRSEHVPLRRPDAETAPSQPPLSSFLVRMLLSLNLVAVG